MSAAAALPLDALRDRVPGLELAEVRLIDEGWDSWVYAVGAWIFRIPRRPEVERFIRAEIALLWELAPLLPAAVPRYEVVLRDGRTCAGYRRIEGQPLRRGGSGAVAGDLGAFLSALHGFPPERAAQLGVEAAGWDESMRRLLDDFEGRVWPLLDRDERLLAGRRFSRFLTDELAFTPALVHADLGPEHVLVDERGRLAGVIDWTDVRVGDPAIDFAWLLHGLDPGFGAALLAAYRGDVDPRFRERAAFYHLLGPWHEVTYGLDTAREDLVDSGLAGVRARLR